MRKVLVVWCFLRGYHDVAYIECPEENTITAICKTCGAEKTWRIVR